MFHSVAEEAKRELPIVNIYAGSQYNIVFNS